MHGGPTFPEIENPKHESSFSDNYLQLDSVKWSQIFQGGRTRDISGSGNRFVDLRRREYMCLTWVGRHRTSGYLKDEY